VQAITIFQLATILGQGFSSFPHIIASAPLSLTNLNDNFFVLDLICYSLLSFYSLGSYLHKVFYSLFFVDYFFFSLGCVYSCSLLPCIFDGWVLFLDFYI
jgi:hypothetical protein